MATLISKPYLALSQNLINQTHIEEWYFICHNNHFVPSSGTRRQGFWTHVEDYARNPGQVLIGWSPKWLQI